MTRFIMLIPFICLQFLSCEHKYAKSIQKETQRTIELKKNFIKSLSFSGKIHERKTCENCEFNKYQIVVLIEKMNPSSIGLGDQSFQPYYVFNSKDQITLSVTESLYKAIIEGKDVRKESDSNFLIFNEQKYQLLSDRKSQWSPNN